jgi:hypothetical protein
MPLVRPTLIHYPNPCIRLYRHGGGGHFRRIKYRDSCVGFRSLTTRVRMRIDVLKALFEWCDMSTKDIVRHIRLERLSWEELSDTGYMEDKLSIWCMA